MAGQSPPRQPARILPGYLLRELISDAGGILIYRGRQQSDGRGVLVKLPAAQHPAPAVSELLRREYEVGHAVAVPVTLHPLRLLEDDAGLVLEDRGGAPLPVGEPLSPQAFYPLALALVAAVEQLHAHHLVHCALQPVHCYWDPAQGQVYLDGLGQARSDGGQQEPPPALQSEALPYIAPEQTGRMGHGVDQRSDLYALGAILYQLLTGQPPFPGEDAAAIVHAHLARRPQAPQELNPAVPAPLAAVVLKLLEKMPEERYQSAAGLREDLQRCQEAPAADAEAWSPGQSDQLRQFQLPASLYGRERELALLLDVHTAAAAGRSRWALLAGQPGVGKTRLVAALAQQRGTAGYFVGGKYEQLRRHIPYSGLIQALHALVRQLLTGEEAEVAQWRSQLRTALGGNLRVLVDVVPDLELITGPCPPLPALAPLEARQRFAVAMHGLLGTFARPERPLVLFLDDLQWADAASLQLLEELAGDRGLRHLLVIGAYRDNEVTPVHPLAVCLERLEAGERPPLALHLRALGREALDQMVADALHRSPLEIRELADWIAEQTEGNPFFARQLLSSLREQELIAWDEAAGRWSWDLEGARSLGLAADVVHFMSNRLHQLEPESREVLAVAACLGAILDPEVLAPLCQLSLPRLRLHLQAARKAQLVAPLEDGASDEADARRLWRFSHDRVQQAAYDLTKDLERPALHLRIARALHERMREAEDEYRLFDVVNQYNLGRELLEDPVERAVVADLNLQAGLRAKAAAAYETARDYFATGRALLGADAWSRDYPRAMELAIAQAETEYVSGAFDTADALFDETLVQARDPLARARAYSVKIALTTNAGRPEEALLLGARCLAELGVELPVDPQGLDAAVAAELREAERLFDLSRQAGESPPAAARPEQQAVGDVLVRLYPPAYQLGLRHLVLVGMKLVNHVLRHGYDRNAPFAFMNYASILGAFLGDYDKGEQFARTAFHLAAQSPDPFLGTRLDYIYGALVAHWTQPVDDGLSHLQRGFDAGMQAADLVYAALNVSFLFRGKLMRGGRLDDILSDWERYRENVERLRYSLVTAVFRLSRQWILALKGKTDAPTSLADEEFDETACARSILGSAARSPKHWYLLLKAQLYYHWGEFDQAWDWLERADEVLDGAFGQLAVPEHRFYRGLAAAARLPEAGPEAAEALREALRQALDQFDTWARHAPANFEHRRCLLAAESARLAGEPARAMELYEAALRAAGEGGFLRDQALTHELAARCYLSAGFHALARAHMAEAQYDYLRWGATAKARQLASRYPQLVPAGATVAGEPGAGERPDPVDIATVTKASLAIAGELDLAQLLQRLLQVLMENSGASRVALILRRGEDWRVEAVLDTDASDPALPGATLDDYPELAHGALNYCRRTRKAVLLDDPAGDRGFNADPYLQSAAAPKSLLCLPVVRQGRVLGLLYLENRYSAGTFSRRRLDLLELLTGQAATALENALLYDDLKQQIGERRRAERAAREGERRWRAFLDNASLAAVSLDLDGCVEYVNPYLLELTGYQRDELVGQNWFELMTPARYRRHDLQGRFYELLKDQPHISTRAALLTRDGTERYLSWSHAWLRNPEGDLIGTVSIGEDITERVHAEREVRRLNRELEQRVIQRTAQLAAANEELEAFAYAVSHDLRAPLRSIDGFSQALEEDYGEHLDEEGRDYLQRVQRAARRMNALIDALLQLSRLTRGELRREPVDLSVLAEQVLQELREAEPQRAVRAVIEPELRVWGDPRLLRILLQNLLGNAWKYSADRQPAEIAFGAERRGRERVYSVRDNGAGFDMAYADRLFVAFQRLHGADRFEGSGIGLTTVQRIVHRHGGRIWAEGAPDQGATFYFTLDGEG